MSALGTVSRRFGQTLFFHALVVPSVCQFAQLVMTAAAQQQFLCLVAAAQLGAAALLSCYLLCMCRRFWKFVSQPPVKILEVIDEADAMAEPLALETPRFMAVVWGAGAQGDGPTTIVQLDGNGGCAV